LSCNINTLHGDTDHTSARQDPSRRSLSLTRKLRGVGLALLTTLLASTDAAGIWTIQSGIFPENLASLCLLQRAGFHIIGTRERIGRPHGQWRDVLSIERRSTAMN
jgi:phosphinothricin acetyltransferase